MPRDDSFGPWDPAPQEDRTLRMGYREDELGGFDGGARPARTTDAGATRQVSPRLQQPVPSPPQQPFLGDTSPRGFRRSREPQGEPVLRRAKAPSPVYAGGSGGGFDGNGAGDRRRPERRRPAPPRHGCLSFLLWIVLLACLGLMALRGLPTIRSEAKAVPELVSFVPLVFAPLLVCFALAAIWHRRVLLVFSAAALAVTMAWHAGYFIPKAQVSSEARTTVSEAADTDDSAARIMTLNTYNGHASAAEIVALVRSRHVEVLCLEELTDSLVQQLSAAGLDELLPYHVISDGASGINNGGRNGIWSAAPMSNVSTNLLPINTSSMPAADIRVGGKTVRIVAVHPNSPVRGAQDEWRAGLAVIQSLSGYDHAYVICGDFNSTWDHSRFRELLGNRFVDAGEQSGQGFHMTFPSGGVLPPLIEIDHFVYAKNSGIVISDLETYTISGTDHKALVGILEVA